MECGVTMTADHSSRPSKRRGRHPEKALTAAKARTAGPGRYADGNGLFLQVDPSGARRWVQRLVIRGKRRDLGLGSCALVTLAEARELARENRRTARAGGDPRRRTRIVPTLAEAFEEVVAIRRPTWTDGGKSEAQWRASFRDYALPRLGERSVDSIDTSDVLAVLTPLWNAKPVSANRLRQRLDAVMRWSIAQGFRANNPADGDTIALALPARNGRAKVHLAALPWTEVPRFLERLRAAAETRPLVKSAIEFAILTAARSGEVRLAAWSEIDEDGRVWTIPAERMKAARQHRVPLSARALAVLGEARLLDDGSGLIFPSSRPGRPMDASRLLRPIRDLGFDATLHGFRSSFRDWCGEATNTPREVAEAALAHVVSNAAEAAYARSDLFEKRRALMDRWAAFVAGEDGKVVPIAARRG